jgi:hypothetical protein
LEQFPNIIFSQYKYKPKWGGGERHIKEIGGVKAKRKSLLNILLAK